MQGHPDFYSDWDGDWDEVFNKAVKRGYTRHEARWIADGQPVCPHCDSLPPADRYKQIRIKKQAEADAVQSTEKEVSK